MSRHNDFNPTFIYQTVIVILIIFVVFLLGKSNLSGIGEFLSTAFSVPTPIPTKTPGLDGDILFTVVNEWESQHGYKAYVKDDNLCTAADKILADSSIRSDENWFQRVGLSSSYSNSSWLATTNGYSEESVLNGWLNDPKLVKTVRDSYYKYACARCSNFDCVMMFANIYTPSDNGGYRYIPPPPPINMPHFTNCYNTGFGGVSCYTF